jgi:hypothetical protein
VRERHVLHAGIEEEDYHRLIAGHAAMDRVHHLGDDLAGREVPSGAVAAVVLSSDSVLIGSMTLIGKCRREVTWDSGQPARRFACVYCASDALMRSAV